MPKREEEPKQSVVKSPLWKKAEKLLTDSGVIDQLAEHEERTVKLKDGTKLPTIFMTFNNGKESLKEVLYYFYTLTSNEYDYYFLEINGKEEILMFYKDDR